MTAASARILVAEGAAALAVAKALGSETRQAMLGLLTDRVLNVSGLASAMDLPHSTVSFNLNQLMAVGLVEVEVEPGTHGRQKLCSKRYDEVRLRLPGAAVDSKPNVMTVHMPVGSYRQVEAGSPCGLASESKLIGLQDEPRSFFEPEHVYAQLLWFGGDGYVEYAFPNNLPFGALPSQLELSMEICSEAPFYNEDWPSDITLWINDVEVGTWTSPGDFGGKASLLTPAWWKTDRTTHGLLKQWSVGPQGAMIDGMALSGVSIGQLVLPGANHIKVRLGVKPDARHRGGLNLFGRKFGNYPQDIVMRVAFDFARGAVPNAN